MSELNVEGMALAPGVVETIVSIAVSEVEGVACVGSAGAQGRGVRAVYADGSVLTGDIRKATGSSAPAASCTEFTEALIAAIKAQA